MTSTYGPTLPSFDTQPEYEIHQIAAQMSRSTLVRLQPRLYQGTHVRHPLVSSYRARTVEIHADGITGYADGERACPLPVTVTADPGALRLLV